MRPAGCNYGSVLRAIPRPVFTDDPPSASGAFFEFDGRTRSSSIHVFGLDAPGATSQLLDGVLHCTKSALKFAVQRVQQIQNYIGNECSTLSASGVSSATGRLLTVICVRSPFFTARTA
jgi:hypothetical protein